MRRGSKGGIMKKSGFGAFVLMVGLSATGISGLVLTSTENGIAQGQGMQNMPGMNLSQSKPAAQKKKTSKKKPAKKHNMANMPGMNMSGMKMSGMHKHTRRKKRTARRRQSTTKHKMGNMAGKKKTGTPTAPTSHPSPPQKNKTGMKKPRAKSSPSPTPLEQQMHITMPD